MAGSKIKKIGHIT